MQFKQLRIANIRALAITFVALDLVLLGACGGSLYKVAPLPQAPVVDLNNSSAGGLEISAGAMSDDRAMAQFDANLPLAGLIAVEVRLSNHASTAIPAGSLRASLLDTQGKALKPLRPKNALGRVMKFYKVRLYAKEGYARTVEAYESIALHLDREVPPLESAMGVLFFDTKAPVSDFSRYRLSITGGPAPITLQLN